MTWPPACRCRPIACMAGVRQALIGRVPAQVDQRHPRRLRGPGPLRQRMLASSVLAPTFSNVSSDGVAEPSTIGHLRALRARTTARSRAE